MPCAGTEASLATTRKTVDKSGDRTRVGQKQVRKVTNMLMDGRGVVSKLKDGGRQQTMVESRSTAPKDANPGRVKNRESQGGKDHQ